MFLRSIQTRAFSVCCRTAARRRVMLGPSQANREFLQNDAPAPLPDIEPLPPTVEAPKPAVAARKPKLKDAEDEFVSVKPMVPTAHAGSVDYAISSDPKRAKKQEHTTCLYWETNPPTQQQLEAAEYFFTRKPAKHIWTQAQFKKIPMSEAPEVVFMGRSNVGKSSTLNAIFNARNLARTSKAPGATKLFHAYSVCDGKLVVLDTPGYGFRSRETWGTQIMKYLTGRKQLRRAFVLVDAMHGFKETDFAVMSSIAAEGVSYEIVLSKQDRVPKADHEKMLMEAKDMLTDSKETWSTTVLGEIVGVQAAPKDRNIPRRGMNELRWAMVVACGLEEYVMKLRK